MFIIAMLSSVIDIVCLMLYMHKFFQRKREQISFPFELFCFILMAVILELNTRLNTLQPEALQIAVTVTVSTASTLALTFLYIGSLIQKLFVVISFQVYATLAENLTISIFSIVNKTALEGDDLFGLSNLLLFSKVLIFIFVIITVLIFNHKKDNHSLGYSLLTLFTPIMLMAFYLTISNIELASTKTSYIYIALEFILISLNILNYFLLDNLLEKNALAHSLKEKEFQLQNQQNNFDNLSSAYKSNRRLIHDMNKHYFYMRECLRNKEYDKLAVALDTGMDEIKGKYVICNTGNLVIDTFINNYTELAQKSAIQLITNIKVQNLDVPIEDYDHCIVLGNMLDNCLNACKKLDSTDKYIDIKIMTTERQYIIKTVNPYSPEELAKKDSINHGYGIPNIESVVELYGGVFSGFTKENEYIAISIIPIFRDSNGFAVLHKKC